MRRVDLECNRETSILQVHRDVEIEVLANGETFVVKLRGPTENIEYRGVRYLRAFAPVPTCVEDDGAKGGGA